MESSSMPLSYKKMSKRQKQFICHCKYFFFNNICFIFTLFRYIKVSFLTSVHDWIFISSIYLLNFLIACFLSSYKNVEIDSYIVLHSRGLPLTTVYQNVHSSALEMVYVQKVKIWVSYVMVLMFPLAAPQTGKSFGLS